MNTAQKVKFSITDFFSKRDQIRRELRSLVTFTEEICNGKLYFFVQWNLKVTLFKLIFVFNYKHAYFYSWILILKNTIHFC